MATFYGGTLPIGSGGTGAITAADARISLDLIDRRRIFRCPIPPTASFNPTIAGTAYWLYIGYFPDARSIAKIGSFLTNVSTVDSVCSLAMATTPLAPNKAAQVLTKIANSSTATIDDLTANANRDHYSSAINCSTGTGHVWAGICPNTGGTQPGFRGLQNEYAHGFVLVTAGVAGSSIHTGAGPWTGSTVTDGNSAVGVDLFLTMD